MAAAVAAGPWLHFNEQLTSIPEAAAGAGVLPLPSPRGSLEGCTAGLRGEPRVRPMRKCASTPTLHSMSAACGGESDSQGMEVYVVLRPFKEFGGGLFNRMPRRLRAGVRDAGICHYLAVFKQRDGSLVQFDFGPRGGDIHVARGPFAFLSKSADGKMRRHVPGEVRERRLVRLPEAHMFVGHTPLSLADIRAWNSLQEAGSMDYELHRNDCRHYINCLVRYTTGREAAASAMLQHQWARARSRGRYGLASGVVRVTQWFTDLANWSKVQLLSNVSMYGAMAVSGQKALARLKPLALLPGGGARLQPMTRVLAAPVRQALARKPVVVGASAAVATLAASNAEGPVAKEGFAVGARVAGTLRTAAQATLAAASSAVSRAGAATSRTTSHAAAVAGSLAGVATRGAAGMMAGRSPALDAAAPPPSGGIWGGRGPSSPPRASLPSLRGADRSQRLALAITSAARR